MDGRDLIASFRANVYSIAVIQNDFCKILFHVFCLLSHAYINLALSNAAEL